MAFQFEKELNTGHRPAGGHITDLATEVLKLGKLTAGDVGQMHLYLNYAREHWTHPDENPPVGLILCAEHQSGVARYALEGLPNKILAAEYRMTLPSEEILAAELARSRKMLEERSDRAPGKRKNRRGTS